MKEEATNNIQNKEIRFVGLSRSGNHAIINWVIHQLEGTYCFLNCAEPKNNPFLSARPLGKGGLTYKTNITSFNLQQEQQGRFSEKDYLIHSYEDCFLGSLTHSVYRKNRDQWIGSSAKRKNLLILRDPFNLFASRMKSNLLLGQYTHHGTRPISVLTLKRIYKQHAGEFLGERNYLKNKVPVSFNSWASDKEYRRSITEELGLSFTDKGFEKVSKVAGGSSFDGLKHSGNANKMELQSRWKEFASDDSYWQLFDDELAELTLKIFGDIPAVKHYEQFIKTNKKNRSG